jgi:hypothetical protein
LLAQLQLLFAGYGVEAAIGKLTRLTSLHLRLENRSPGTPLQLQLLGCGRAASSSDSGGSSSGRSSDVCGGTTARSSVGLQELSLECRVLLSDDELAVAAAALPDLRLLDLDGHSRRDDAPQCGSGLAAFSACRRLRNVSLRRFGDLEGMLLVMQVPQIASLASLHIEHCRTVTSSVVTELQAEFRQEHGRNLRVEKLPDWDDDYSDDEITTESESEPDSDSESESADESD